MAREAFSTRPVSEHDQRHDWEVRFEDHTAYGGATTVARCTEPAWAKRIAEVLNETHAQPGAWFPG